jgi:hypothetical protein
MTHSKIRLAEIDEDNKILATKMIVEITTP